MNNQPELLKSVQIEIRRKSLSRKTENAYLNHIGRFLKFYGDEDIFVRRADKISRFLENLKTKAADATCNQAHSALLFFYRDVLGQTLSAQFEKIGRVRLNVKKHEIFTDAEVRKILKNLHGAPFLVASLVYGSGLRLAEAVALRVGDVDFQRREIKVRHAQNGAIERRTILPISLEKHLQRQIKQVENQYEDDIFEGFGQTFLPKPLTQCFPNAANELAWQYLFPALKLTAFNGGKNFMRLHLAESTIQKSIAEAAEKARIKLDGGCQTLRYSFASRLFEQHCDVHIISRLLGHRNLRTTLNYFQVPHEIMVNSPLDVLKDELRVV